MNLRSGVRVPLSIDHRFIGRVEPLRRDVAGDADDFQDISLEIPERLAERIGFGPELPRKFLRDNNRTSAHSARWIAISERATAYDRDPDRGKEIRRHPVHRHPARSLARNVDVKHTPVIKQSPAGVCDRLYSWQSFETRREHPATRRPGLLLCRSVARIHLHDECPPRFKTRISAIHFLNCANSHPGAEKQ